MDSELNSISQAIKYTYLITYIRGIAFEYTSGANIRFESFPDVRERLLSAKSGHSAVVQLSGAGQTPHN